MNIYKKILKQNIPRLLSLYNTDPFSITYGYGDREFWGWKTKDFVNGTLQGGVHALAIALKLGLFNTSESQKILNIIDSAIRAISKMQASNGSMVEAYPQENSFCVTALVAFDALSAIFYLNDEFTSDQKSEFFSILRPLITFISAQDEEHAIISNHLATAVAAVILWNHLTRDNNPRGHQLLNQIYTHQSDEGWYKEYEAADPGYQTLCTYYLACAYQITKDSKLLDSLERSIKFLKNFIHPDGTIGGLYGSRNTEVYYPGGIVVLSSHIDECAMMENYLSPKSQHILPQDIDIGNYIPLLNSYAVAALHYERLEQNPSPSILPFNTQKGSIVFQEAGIYIHSNHMYFAILNFKKGGTLKVFNKETASIDIEDGGLFGRLDNGTKFSTQQFDETASFENNILKSHFYKINDTYPSPVTFIILRILGLSIFKSVRLGNLFKKFIVSMLMTGKKKLDGAAEREFIFLEQKIIVKEHIAKPSGCKEILHYGKSKAIHMASSGYFLPQNFHNSVSTLVEFQNV